MSRVNVEIELPDTLAMQAKKAGLLESEALERMVREALLLLNEFARGGTVGVTYFLPRSFASKVTSTSPEPSAPSSPVGSSRRPMFV
jgi:hypothetical protein